MRALLRTLVAGLQLSFWRRPPAELKLRPASHFWWLLLLGIGLSILRDRWIQPDAADFYLDGLQSDALGSLLMLAAAALIANRSRQRVLTWSIAVLASATNLWIAAILMLARWLLWQQGLLDLRAEYALFGVACFWWLISLYRVISLLIPGWPGWRRMGASTVAAMVTIVPFLFMDQARYWYPIYDPEAMGYSDSADTPPQRRIHGSAEALIYRQPAMIAQALDQLLPDTPGVTDAYLLAFGADANEDVFRNEVGYAQTLFSRRFGMQGRTLTLLNHPDTTEDLPLATLGNLRLALAGIGSRMNRQEDLLILFLTTHGSPDHELYVDLQPLPLDPIKPGDLREALDAAGIDWRVIIVSACYSGGFIDDLATPMSLVITAARRDRPSFGCGDDSELTYFGRAMLVEALNQTRSLTGAFELASEAVREREIADDFEPSEPQMSLGAFMGPRLQAWSQSLAPAPQVAFVPRSANSSCSQDGQACPEPEQ